MRTGTADLPLHPGRAPRWLIARMSKLAGAVLEIMLAEYGTRTVLERLSDPFWFQALGCALGFDWHSSGVTTVVTGVLKSVVRPSEHGLAVCGGKGARSRGAPEEIERNGLVLSVPTSRVEELKRASYMAAKVDNAALQDGFPLYHHVFIFDEAGRWIVVQQGMNTASKLARRYHWFSEKLSSFVVEPHQAIVGYRQEKVLNMVARESEEARRAVTDLVNEGVGRLRRWAAQAAGMSTLDGWIAGEQAAVEVRRLEMPWTINWKAVEKAYELSPRNFEGVLEVRGLGPATVRGLALLSKLIYGVEPSWRDPVKYSFAFGGKDGVPFPVDRKAMDSAIQFLWDSIRMAEVGEREKLEALRRLSALVR